MDKYLGKNLIKVIVPKISKELKNKEDVMELDNIDIEQLWKCKSQDIHVPVQIQEGTKILKKCSVCDKIIEEIEVAPSNEYLLWKHTLDGDYIKIDYYNDQGRKSNVVLYPYYEINGKIYKTKLVSHGYFISSSKIINSNNYIRDYVTSIEIKEGIDYSEFTYGLQLFFKCINLQSIIFPKDFDTSRMTTMGDMFRLCSSLSSLDLTSFDTTSVSSMNGMFDSCSSLTQILVSKNKWKISPTTTIVNMFNKCLAGGVTYIEDL